MGRVLASQPLSCAEDEITMLRWICRQMGRDKIRNKDIQNKVGIASVVDKMSEARLEWFGQVKM